MGFSNDIQEEEFKVIEKFTCALYGKPKFNSVNEVRLELFLKKYRPKKKEENVISCIKKMEGREIAFIMEESPTDIKPFEMRLGIK